MSTAPDATADVPMPDEHVADIAERHDVSEADLREALAETYASLADGADAIHQAHEADDATPEATEAAEGLASVIHVERSRWEATVDNLSGRLRDAVRAVHDRFTDDLTVTGEVPDDYHPLVVPSSRIGRLVRAGLSRRQAQVQVLTDAGLSSEDIAELLGIAESTVNVHRHRIGTKVEDAERLLEAVGR